MAQLRRALVAAAMLASAGAAASPSHEVAGEGPVVVAGATGRTGLLVYRQLKEKGVPVRAMVRNATKARELLGCSKCDASEGIYIADVTKPETLPAPMKGASSLVIASSASPVCDPFPQCHFPPGATPVDVDWIGAKAMLTTFAEATSGRGHVALISTMGTTTPEKGPGPDPFGHIYFYKLNFEAVLMSSGVPFTVIKPCGLVDKDPTKTELLVGHDDGLEVKPPLIARADVARVTIAALQNAGVADGLRFDLCSKEGPATQDGALAGLLKSARMPWQREAPAPLVVV